MYTTQEIKLIVRNCASLSDKEKATELMLTLPEIDTPIFLTEFIRICDSLEMLMQHCKILKNQYLKATQKALIHEQALSKFNSLNYTY